VVDADTNEVSVDAPLFWQKPVKWFRYEMVDKETGKAEDASTKDDCCAGEDDEWQKVKPKTSTRVLDRVEKRGTIIDFLDDWEPVFVRMCHHRWTLTQCKAADIHFERNAPPGWLKIDCDFAENFTILKKKALQSMYWMQLQCTIFVCVMSFVDKGKFFDMTIELAKDDEVTVKQDAGASFWAVIDTVEKDGAEVSYILRDASGKLVQDEHGSSIRHERRCLHKREWTTNAIIGFTSDRKHDSYATQFFLTKALNFAATEQSLQGFTEVHIHSDNAGSARWFERLLRPQNYGLRAMQLSTSRTRRRCGGCRDLKHSTGFPRRLGPLDVLAMARECGTHIWCTTRLPVAVPRSDVLVVFTGTGLGVWSSEGYVRTSPTATVVASR
jgi:hypothetical protein